jgi:hypothetical protein
MLSLVGFLSCVHRDSVGVSVGVRRWGSNSTVRPTRKEWWSRPRRLETTNGPLITSPGAVRQLGLQHCGDLMPNLGQINSFIR